IQQDKLAESEGDVILSLVDLFKALGTGWQIRLGVESPEEVDAANPAANRPTLLPPVAPPEPGAGAAADNRSGAKVSFASEIADHTETIIATTLSLEPGSLKLRTTD
ncbi:MAG: hypothetical protein N2C12_02405, partial [Planctomycetales bacterium]